MKDLVIGGAGFIGCHLCGALLEKGDEVFCLDNFSLGTREGVERFRGNRLFHLMEADASDSGQLESAFEEARPDRIYHLAANSDIRASAADPEVEYRNTYTTTYRILDCMRKYQVRKIFFASTSAVYGDRRDILLREDTPGLSPISYYGAAKLGSEALISAFTHMNDMEALIFRFPNVTGPGLTHGVIYDFIRKLEADSGHLEILGDGRQEKPYIYVTDLVNAITEFMGKTGRGVSLYNLGTEGSTSVTKIADILCREMGLEQVKYCYTGGEGGWKGDVPRFRYCLDKIHGEGWKAAYTSDEAVEKAIRMTLNEMQWSRG